MKNNSSSVATAENDEVSRASDKSASSAKHPQSPKQQQPPAVAGLNAKKQVNDKTSIGNAAFLVQSERADPSGKKYYGVSFMYKIGRWRATLYVRGGKTKQLGVFQNAKKAALVYDKAARAE